MLNFLPKTRVRRASLLKDKGKFHPDENSLMGTAMDEF